jgi:hypothetical protein
MPRALDPHFIGDAGPRQPHEFGEWRIRPTRAAGQRGNETGHGGVAVTVERAQCAALAANVIIDCAKAPLRFMDFRGPRLPR